MTVQKNQRKRGKNYFCHREAEKERKQHTTRQDTTYGAVIISSCGKNYFVTEKIIRVVIRQQRKADFPDEVDEA
jgi:hypothetical protein